MRLEFGMLLIVATISLSSVAARAEENGSGHYFPGAFSSFMDMLPDLDVDTVALYNASTYYHGSGGFQFTGGSTDANATTYANTSVFLYQLRPIEKLGGGQYAIAVAVPYVWLKVNGTLSFGQSRTRFHDTDNGFGDIDILPIMMGWKIGDWKLQSQLGVYVPTGNFEKNNAANIGRNYWTFEPSAAVSYFGLSNGIEFTTSVGFDFNTKNGATRYQSGDQFHLDGTLAQHLQPFGEGRGIVGAGVNGFFYQQITSDSGRGAAPFGDFEAMTTGVGPVLSFVRYFGTVAAGAEVKWLPEISVSNRLSGNIVWLKIGISWPTGAPAAPSSVFLVSPSPQPLSAVSAL